MPRDETPLESVEGWPEDHVRKLGDSWINTAEQVVALGATPGGIKSLAESLGVEETEAVRLVGVARAHLRPETAAELERPVDTVEYGLGALGPSGADEDAD
jgi:hypothetical protein